MICEECEVKMDYDSKNEEHECPECGKIISETKYEEYDEFKDDEEETDEEEEKDNEGYLDVD